MSESVVFSASLSLVENSGRLTCRAQQPQEQRYPFLSVCAVFSWVLYRPIFFLFFPLLFLGGHLSEIFKALHDDILGRALHFSAYQFP